MTLDFKVKKTIKLYTSTILNKYMLPFKYNGGEVFMARPNNKDEVISLANDTFNKLEVTITSIPKQMLDIPFSFDLSKEKGEHWKRDKNIKDVIVHLYEWQQLLINWITSNMNGESKPFLPSEYNWKTYGKMNYEILEKHQSTSLDDALNSLKHSHIQVLKLLTRFNDTKLFTKNQFKWVGGSTLGSYFISTTSSHYTWANQKIKKFAKSKQIL